ncbi:hypothetical protein PPTG_12588 [Phytophthora nicotianae INRA-310]|uniref:Uncharacterized protein n=1 Tax=Phytophthora nicotianae (strain INRA-310) TaxID=761204 RepID=W2Q0Q4_PHYN3|nr:hypothetical protein PPTG_12588 [Phytophthora nicotianae INRA-310]ETN06466.1 hypothetical protein PPTG_12588 [Phytophthora nicotianae INRA-310]
MDDFKLFLDIWRDYRTLATHNIFIKANGKADTYLTRHFQRITQREFQVDVSIRDCRSIFINHAKKLFDLTEMYELSRQMCHSFQMQQSEYRADDSIERAFNVLSTMTKHIGDLPLCDMDAAIYQEEREAIAAETELTREDD